MLFIASAAYAQNTDAVNLSIKRKLAECKEKDATSSLTVICSLDGIFENHKEVFYFHMPLPDDPSDFSSAPLSFADSLVGTGFGLSMGVNPGDTAVKVKISAYWTTTSARGKSNIEILVPLYKKKKGMDAGFTYSATWRKMEKKKEVNQTPAPARIDEAPAN